MFWMLLAAVAAGFVLAHAGRTDRPPCRACGGTGRVSRWVGRRQVQCTRCGGAGVCARRSLADLYPGRRER